jgi:ATP-dependent helicase HrpB
MADVLGERVGQTVGYRMRMDSAVSKQTRIEVVTEGILSRMLQDDPSLSGIGLVIFDEFHERSLDADLGLALTLEGRSLFGDLRDCSLKILLMSATLDGQRIADLFCNEDTVAAEVLRSEGRQYPVNLHYGEPYRHDQNTVERVCNVVLEALGNEHGSILVFLPGQGEIRRCASNLAARVASDVVLAPLYGDLSLVEQRLAIAPAPIGQRKVVLATSIAESSLTIDGIRVVVDSGLARLPAFDPRTGMTRLSTKRLSRASSQQRAGRAGRLSEGACYRLWSESQQKELAAYNEAEIMQADLSGFALQLMRWGIADPEQLTWLDPPPAAAFQQALDLLLDLGALTVNEHSENTRLSITAHGEEMAGLPVHPRLAHMLLKGRELGAMPLACAIAALLSERDFGSRASADIHTRLSVLQGEQRVDRQQQGLLARLKKQQAQYLRILGQGAGVGDKNEGMDAAVLLAFAYPDRIAKQRRERGRDYVLSNGRAASLNEADPLNGSPWLVVASLGGTAGGRNDFIQLAAELDPVHFDGLLASQVKIHDRADWHDEKGRFVAERRHLVGGLLVRQTMLGDISSEQKAAALLAFVQRGGLTVFDWPERVLQWRERVMLADKLNCEPGDWPDLSDDALLSSVEDWLAPYLSGVNSLNDFKRLEIGEILAAWLDWPQRQALDSLFPERFTVPSGSSIKIDYCQPVPVLAVKLQEMFGCTVNPTVGNGRQVLLLHLLSPARRPLQVTQDLAGFWQGSYHDVKKEMKGRYPKHPWPENPLESLPTARLKPRGT